MVNVFHNHPWIIPPFPTALENAPRGGLGASGASGVGGAAAAGRGEEHQDEAGAACVGQNGAKMMGYLWDYDYGIFIIHEDFDGILMG